MILGMSSEDLAEFFRGQDVSWEIQSQIIDFGVSGHVMHRATEDMLKILGFDDDAARELILARDRGGARPLSDVRKGETRKDEEKASPPQPAPRKGELTPRPFWIGQVTLARNLSFHSDK